MGELHPHSELVAKVEIKVILCNQRLVERGLNVLGYKSAAIDVCSGFEDGRHGFLGRVHVMVGLKTSESASQSEVLDMVLAGVDWCGGDGVSHVGVLFEHTLLVYERVGRGVQHVRHC